MVSSPFSIISRLLPEEMVDVVESTWSRPKMIMAMAKGPVFAMLRTET